jgi:hypothetical protein
MVHGVLAAGELSICWYGVYHGICCTAETFLTQLCVFSSSGGCLCSRCTGLAGLDHTLALFSGPSKLLAVYMVVYAFDG